MPVAPGASSTVADLVDDTRRLLGGDGRVEYNRLDGSIATTTVESFTAEFAAGGIVAGSYVAVDDELMLVTSVSGSTVNVLRGMLGSTAATHADDTLVEVNPRFSRLDIKSALQQEINSWSPRLFQVATLEVEASDLSTSHKGAWSQAVDADGIASDWLFGLELRHGPWTGGTSWPKVRHWSLDRDANTDSFASGTALFVGSHVPAGTLRLVYAKPMAVTTFSDGTTLEETVGVPGTALDIPSIGAAWRLLAPREVERASPRRQNVSEAADGVPPGHMTSAAASLKRMRDERISQESLRLRTLYPLRTGS